MRCFHKNSELNVHRVKVKIGPLACVKPDTPIFVSHVLDQVIDSISVCVCGICRNMRGQCQEPHAPDKKKNLLDLLGTKAALNHSHGNQLTKDINVQLSGS